MKTIDTAGRLDRSLDIVIQREIDEFRKESLDRREAEQRKKKTDNGPESLPTEKEQPPE